MRRLHGKNHGFTLIELSIVLVIIGLIVGGILVGQDLIKAAETRAQITQIEKYNQAVNTFKTKYAYIPGDIPDPYASNFGFAARGAYRGEGDGNGLIEGIDYNNPTGWDGWATFAGETAMFWVDLSTARMIDGSFATATSTATPGLISSTAVANYFPAAKIGHGNYVSVINGGWGDNIGFFATPPSDGQNYFSVTAITGNQGSGGGIDEAVVAATTITVSQAYNIDKKIDDGLPQNGKVMAVNIGASGVWAAGGGLNGASDPTTGGPVVAGDGVATAPSATTCYDNGSAAGATENYSTEYQNGSNPNCSLIFRIQGAAR
jgi:prepilin-type N-terminal cleavage/methylation domain-containing protein